MNQIRDHENALAKALGRTEGMEQDEPAHPQSRTHCVHHDCAYYEQMCCQQNQCQHSCTVSAGEESDRVPVGWCW